MSERKWWKVVGMNTTTLMWAGGVVIKGGKKLGESDENIMLLDMLWFGSKQKICHNSTVRKHGGKVNRKQSEH